MEEQNVIQRRKYARVRFSEPIQFYFKGTNRYGGSVASDISEDGIRISLNDFFPVNTELSLSVQLTAEKVIDCIGRIVWIEKFPYSERYRAGLKFTENNANVISRTEIHHFLFPGKT